MTNKRLYKMPTCSRIALRTTSSRSIQYGQIGTIGKVRDNSLIRASNLIVRIMPILIPKLRKVARRPFSLAMAFD
jgi:hypothetical protein